MRFDDKYFIDFNFTKDQLRKNYDNALKDLRIAKEDKIIEVKFTYTYSAFIKGGITLLSFHNKKVKSVPGHHIKIIEVLASILKDQDVEIMGNAMRLKRNRDFYEGGVEVSQKESAEYLEFAGNILDKIKEIIS
jgi:hypothetical protein